MLIINKDNFEEEVLKSSIPVLIDFTASWCGYCKMIAPILNELEQEMKDIKFVKLDVDANPQIAKTFGIMSIPNLIIMENGNKIGNLLGFKNKDEIINFLDESIKKISN